MAGDLSSAFILSALKSKLNQSFAFIIYYFHLNNNSAKLFSFVTNLLGTDQMPETQNGQYFCLLFIKKNGGAL